MSLVEDVDRESIIDLFIDKPYKEFKYSQWNGSIIRTVSFVEEVIINANKLLNFISVLNPQLLNSENIQLLKNKVSELIFFKSEQYILEAKVNGVPKQVHDGGDGRTYDQMIDDAIYNVIILG
ncbi:hypothetical protein [Paenibacillus sp. FSL H8-457]|uniref:hypothetical protein n=1 Tax=Paenibacillus sp. FSL H8-457 TaxID=1227351 RepID=UPI0003E28ABC|nr:hypothetical protein [Paenibacillus sp. FSL H8-457]ETT65623.1 hypothetical protein C172_11241 [Paenibacillus sp. FSL H8-457]